MSLLEIESLSIGVPVDGGATRTLVEAVSLEVDEGQFVGLAGESGSGKTLTAMSALGLLPDRATASGHVWLSGTDMLTAAPARLRALRGTCVAAVFQDPMTSLHPMLSVGQQLTEHVRYHFKTSRRDARRRAVALLEQVRIPDPERALDAFPHRFSGGMRQRIAIASALACEPRLLIADEISTALDVTVQAGILRLLTQLREQTGMAVVLITHDLGVMNVTADELHVMYSGRIVERGPTRQVLADPRNPYTRALLDALPDGGAQFRPLVPIPGDAASPEARPPGCAFHPRCQYRSPGCEQLVPPLAPVAPHRASACLVDPFAEGKLAVAAPTTGRQTLPRSDDGAA